jgi:L-ascorbate metabolism protein UlaG (beta-lactamase superfamily)
MLKAAEPRLRGRIEHLFLRPHMRNVGNQRTFLVKKLRSLSALVGESAFRRMEGKSQHPVLVDAEELGITFIGHSSFLIQIGGRNVLIDPVFARRLVVLRRLRRPGIRLRSLPPIDVVLLSHAHMDHLNRPSLRRIVMHNFSVCGRPPIAVVPWGVKDLVADLGFERIVSLEWWQSARVAGLDVTMTPCKHWGARFFKDTHRGYGGYVIRAGGHSIYHSGDTAYFNGFAQIGRRLAPEVALLPIGAYRPDSYRSVHTSPEEALQAFIDVGASRMIPMHYGTFRLSQEPVEEPVQRLLAAARSASLTAAVQVLPEGETDITAAVRVPTAR